MIKICSICGNEFEGISKWRDERKFCSRSCANKSRVVTPETKTKIKNSIQSYLISNNKQKITYTKVCKCCEKQYLTKNDKSIYCSRSCANKIQMLNGKASTMGIKSASLQVKRSKNEIYFYELCESEFKHLRNNEIIFNGWDADIIIDDIKVAVLWNGIWHYKEMEFNNHSLKQVQNRDDIKQKEIIKAGYRPYVIKDMGKYNKKFVEEQFIIFKEWLIS